MKDLRRMKAAPEMNPVTRAAKGANELQAAQIPAYGQGKINDKMKMGPDVT